MKPIFKIILFITLVVPKTLFAQHAFAAIFENREDIVSNQTYFDINNFQTNLTRNAIINDFQYNFCYDFTAVMIDGTRKKVHSKIYSDKSKFKTYVLSEDNRFPVSDSNHFKKIYAAQTLYLERNYNAQDFGKGTFRGIQTDSCWLFKVISGHLSAYSFLTLQDDGQRFIKKSIIAIQKNGGEILPLTRANLIEMVKDDDDARKKIAQNGFYEAILKYNMDKTALSEDIKSPFF